MSKTPSIAVIPSGYKASKVYSVLPTNGDADLDFTRNCVATRVNQNGLLEEVGLNVPRLDYSDGGCPSLLLEPQRTNLVTDAIVGLDIASDITNKVVSPSGLVDATKPIPTTTSGRFQSLIAPSTFATDDILTYSWYSKRISTPNNVNYLGDLEIKTLINLEIEGLTVQIESGINGFDRFQASVKVVDGALESTFRAYFGDIIGVGNQSVAYYGHQLELGTYATSLIYTSGAEATRFDEEASKGNLESYINSSEGVMFIESSALTDSDRQSYFVLSDGTSSNRIILKYDNFTDRIICSSVNSFGEVMSLSSSIGIKISQTKKIAVRFKEDDCALFIDGVKVSSDSNADTYPPNTLKKLTLSSTSGNSQFFKGKIKDLRVYNEALTDAELITLTQ